MSTLSSTDLPRPLHANVARVGLHLRKPLLSPELGRAEG